MRRTLNNRKRRQLAKRQLVFLIAAFGAVIVAVLLVFTVTADNSREGTANAAQELQAKQETYNATTPDQLQLSLGLGGDACFGLEVADIIKTQGTDYPWSGVSALIQDYDLAIVNLEGPICTGDDSGGNQPSSPIRGEPTCLRGMAGAGIDAVSLANDRIMDYGLAGLQETLDFLREQRLEAVGAGANLRLAEEPLVLESQAGARVAVVAMCDVEGGSQAAGESSAGVCPADQEIITNAVKQARKLAPYVVTFLHWGNVGSDEITQRQRDLGHACAEAGANVVVGSHPHVIQGVEMWQGVPIIYSLGDIVFCPQNDAGKTALFAGCRFDGGSLTSLEIVPLSIDQARAQVLSGDAAQEVLARLADSSPGVDLEIDPKTQVAYLNL
jgi:poly-gamma-glutamate capsule biosynthesis protein CapA/YwtB (metallophosphatase superfamily)